MLIQSNDINKSHATINYNRISNNVSPNVNITWVYFPFQQGSTSPPLLRPSSSDTGRACGIPIQR